MKTLKFALGILSISILMAFTLSSSDQGKDHIGTYGDKDMYEITLNEDFTFRYIDHSSGNSINVSGKWSLKGETVILSDYSSHKKIPTKWTLANNGACLKTKKFWTIYTLCKNCK